MLTASFMSKEKIKAKMERWMLREWGERRRDFDRSCALCKAWKAYDYLFQFTNK